MAKEIIAAPGVYETAESRGSAHGVKVGNVLYSTGIVAKDIKGDLVGKGDIKAQARQVYENLGLVLEAAGATWNDVVKYNAYLASADYRQAAREVHYQYVPYYQRAGATIVTPLASLDLLIEVDLIAYIQTPKHCITNVPNVFVPVGSPYAVKVKDMIYVTGQQPIAGGQPPLKQGQVGMAAAHEQKVIGKGDIVAQTEAVYHNLDNILQASGATWSDVVWAHHYMTGDYINTVRDVRYRFMPKDKIAMTGFVCGLVGPEWMIETELIAHLGPKQAFTVPGVAVSPGVAHAVKAGNTIYIQGQVAHEAHEGLVVGAGDIVAQAKFVHQALDKIIKGVGARWEEVVRVKSYLKRQEDILAIRPIRHQYLAKGTYTSTAVVAGFFNPDFLLEVELVLVQDQPRP
ncbi:MAG: RidA family protein [Dehalococcoidia bacterium]